MKSKSSFALVIAGMLLSGSPAYAQDTTVNYDDYSSIIYSRVSSESPVPGWTLGTDSAGNNFAYNNATDPNVGQIYGPSAALTFTGTGIQMTGLTGPNSGYLAYAIDDGPTQFVSTCTSDTTGPSPVIDSGPLPFGTHVLNVQATPFTDCNGTDQGIYSFLVRNGGPLQFSQASTVVGYTEFGNNGFTCAPSTDGSNLSGGHCVSNDSSAQLTANVTGSVVEIYGRPDMEDGSFDVLVNGDYYATFNENWSSQDLDELTSAIVGVIVFPDNGPRTLTIQQHDTANPAYIQIDTITAFSSGNGGGR